MTKLKTKLKIAEIYVVKPEKGFVGHFYQLERNDLLGCRLSGSNEGFAMYLGAEKKLSDGEPCYKCFLAGYGVVYICPKYSCLEIINGT